MNWVFIGSLRSPQETEPQRQAPSCPGGDTGHVCCLLDGMGEVAPRELVMVGLSVLQGLLKPIPPHWRGAVLTVHQHWILVGFFGCTAQLAGS